MRCTDSLAISEASATARSQERGRRCAQQKASVTSPLSACARLFPTAKNGSVPVDADLIGRPGRGP